jgi:hypothetical protein
VESTESASRGPVGGKGGVRAAEGSSAAALTVAAASSAIHASRSAAAAATSAGRFWVAGARLETARAVDDEVAALKRFAVAAPACAAEDPSTADDAFFTRLDTSVQRASRARWRSARTEAICCAV